MSEENEWVDDPDMQEFLEWADQPGPWDEEDDKIHTVGGLTNDKKNGFMSFVNKTMEPEKDIFEQWQEEAQARPWYIKLWDKIRFCYKNELRYYPKYLQYGLENIFYWFKIIWKDRSWDHDFIFVILKHKLKKQAEDLRKYSQHVGAEYYAERIELCVRLIEKIESNFYELESLEFYKLKSWFEPIEVFSVSFPTRPTAPFSTYQTATRDPVPKAELPPVPLSLFGTAKRPQAEPVRPVPSANDGVVVKSNPCLTVPFSFHPASPPDS